LEDGGDPSVIALFESAVADLSAAGADLVDDLHVPGFEHFPRPPQTAATTRADWERFFEYQGPSFPIKSVADVRDAPPGKRVHPLHAARIAEIAAVTLAPEEDPETIDGRKTEQAYRDAFNAAMDLARVEALVLPVWTHPPVLLGDRGQSPQGGMTFIASALQWPVVAVPIGFVGEHLPIGMQFLARPWAEGRLLRLAYAYEQHFPHRRPPSSTPPLSENREVARRRR
jgi:amidase